MLTHFTTSVNAMEAGLFAVFAELAKVVKAALRAEGAFATDLLSQTDQQSVVFIK